MKKFLFFIVSLISISTAAQPITNINIVLNSKFVLDFDSTFINPQNIKSLRVERLADSANLYIETKDSILRFKSIRDILKDYPLYKKISINRWLIPVLYIDDKPINKITDARIDDSYYAEVKFKELEKIKSIEMPCENIIIIEIKLSTTKPKVYIRGDTTEYLKKYYDIEK